MICLANHVRRTPALAGGARECRRYKRSRNDGKCFGFSASKNGILKREDVRRMITGDDLLMMKNGQMLILRGNAMVALSEDMILIDGTRIAADGRVILTDGTFETLVEGQAILIDNGGSALP